MEERVEVALLNSRGSSNADSLYCEECLRVDQSFNDIPNIASRHDPRKLLVLSLKADTANIKPDTTCPSCRDFLNILNEVGPGARCFNLVIGEDRVPKPDPVIRSAWVETTTKLYNMISQRCYLLRRSDYPTRPRNDSVTPTEGKVLPTVLIKSWLHTCEREHEGCRSNPANELNMSLYLIDVVKECITLKPVSNVRYVALSYVWGNVKSTNLTSENMEELQKPRSLSSRSHVATVPQTIRDAMRLTADLDVHYLWVDCLCLIQNDPDISFYLNRMHLIYTNAFLTIVVANKDNANGGITGYDTRSIGRILPGKVINYPNYVFGMFKKTGRADPAAVPWCSRAWTLQEGFFSRRVLVIDDRICIGCMGECWEEGSSFGFKIRSNLSDNMRVLLPTLCQGSLDGGVPDQVLSEREVLPALEPDPEPNWYNYSRAASSFASRALSYDQDSIKAFLGVINFYKSLDHPQCAVTTRLLYGHPICKLSRALLWSSGMAILERRMLLRQDGSFVMPSWSWMAWRHDCQTTGSTPLGVRWPNGRLGVRELQVPIVIYAQCGICLQTHQMTGEKCKKKASPERVEPEYLDPYLYIKAQRAQFGASSYVPESNVAIRYLLTLGTINSTGNIISGEITFDHWPPQSSWREAGALHFIGIYYYEVVDHVKWIGSY